MNSVPKNSPYIEAQYVGKIIEHWSVISKKKFYRSGGSFVCRDSDLFDSRDNNTIYVKCLCRKCRKASYLNKQRLDADKSPACRNCSRNPKYDIKAGQLFGEWKVISPDRFYKDEQGTYKPIAGTPRKGTGKRNPYVACICTSCGSGHFVSLYSLVGGKSSVCSQCNGRRSSESIARQVPSGAEE